MRYYFAAFLWELFADNYYLCISKLINMNNI